MRIVVNKKYKLIQVMGILFRYIYPTLPQTCTDIFNVVNYGIVLIWEHSDPVVECLTRDGGAAASSFTGVTALCP